MDIPGGGMFAGTGAAGPIQEGPMGSMKPHPGYAKSAANGPGKH